MNYTRALIILCAFTTMPLFSASNQIKFSIPDTIVGWHPTIHAPILRTAEGHFYCREKNDDHGKIIPLFYSPEKNTFSEVPYLEEESEEPLEQTRETESPSSASTTSDDEEAMTVSSLDQIPEQGEMSPRTTTPTSDIDDSDVEIDVLPQKETTLEQTRKTPSPIQTEPARPVNESARKSDEEVVVDVPALDAPTLEVTQKGQIKPEIIPDKKQEPLDDQTKQPDVVIPAQKEPEVEIKKRIEQEHQTKSFLKKNAGSFVISASTASLIMYQVYSLYCKNSLRSSLTKTGKAKLFTKQLAQSVWHAIKNPRQSMRSDKKLTLAVWTFILGNSSCMILNR